jgi:hypothetical protein
VGDLKCRSVGLAVLLIGLPACIGRSESGGAGTGGATSAGGGGGRGGSSTGGTGGTGKSVPPESYGDAFAVALCEYGFRCLPPAYSSLYDTREECIAYYTPRFGDPTDHQVVPAAEKGTLRYDAEAVGACFDALAGGPCDLSLATVACSGIEDMGTVEAGNPCSFSGECRNGYCDTATCPGTCVALGNAGALCLSSSECADGFRCAADFCTSELTVGAECGGRESLCVSPNACVLEADDVHRCRPRQMSFAVALGQPCDPAAGINCTGDLSCGFAASSRTGYACAAPSTSGGACVPGAPDPCPGDERCHPDVQAPDFAGVCQLPGALGAPCADTYDCDAYDGTCIGGICRAWAFADEPCVEDLQCALSGSCVNGVCDVPGCRF